MNYEVLSITENNCKTLIQTKYKFVALDALRKKSIELANLGVEIETASFGLNPFFTTKNEIYILNETV